MEGLSNLTDHHRGDGQKKDHSPFQRAEGHGLEDLLEGRKGKYRKLHDKAHQKSLVHGGVGKDSDVEERVAFAADVEGVEELAEGEGGEGHGVGGRGGLAGAGKHVFAQGIGRQGKSTHHEPLPEETQGELPGKQAFPCRTGLLVHDPILYRLHSQGQSGKGVGDQIEPEELDRHKGHLTEIEDGGHENGR